mmetsp:Transcript_446/g.1679  ORF Transcript_446/g.1679 Transcript_446/m.1679 type:complete len:232 (+) Transcript_446:287-982(+)
MSSTAETQLSEGTVRFGVPSHFSLWISPNHALCCIVATLSIPWHLLDPFLCSRSWNDNVHESIVQENANLSLVQQGNNLVHLGLRHCVCEVRINWSVTKSPAVSSGVHHLLYVWLVQILCQCSAVVVDEGSDIIQIDSSLILNHLQYISPSISRLTPLLASNCLSDLFFIALHGCATIVIDKSVCIRRVRVLSHLNVGMCQSISNGDSLEVNLVSFLLNFVRNRWNIVSSV